MKTWIPAFAMTILASAQAFATVELKLKDDFLLRCEVTEPEGKEDYRSIESLVKASPSKIAYSGQFRL